MFYLIDKPKGISSFKAISNFANENNIKKIGHSGTLDPLASGALLVATDDDTKLLEYLSNENKTYFVTFKIGYVSDTYDVEGNIKQLKSLSITLANLKKIINSFQGEIQQTPPNFSAKKINGKKSYEPARKGIYIKLKPVNVQIFKIWDFKKILNNVFSFQVEVSKGTYIRSLIHDIGIKLHSGAIMTELRRTKIGDLQLVKNKQEINPFDLIKLDKLILNDITNLLHGKDIYIKDHKDGIYILVFKNHIIGIGEINNSFLKSKKLLGNRVQKII